MAPEHLGLNMWRVSESEFIVGTNGQRLEGPVVVRIREFPDFGESGRLGIQAGSKYLEVEGLDFVGAVQREKDV